MYNLIKKIARAILPKKVLDNQKRNLRQFYGLVYRGSKYQCNICEIRLRKFIRLKSNDLLCPNCGSLPRTRGLWNLIKDQLQGKIILHFSPPSSLKAAIEIKGESKKYLTTDFSDEFDTEFNFDIENIDLEDNSVDSIICYHVLEHIPNDLKALSELYRVLKNDGTIFIQTPFKEGATYEDPTITEPMERLKHFGQEDHLRIYSPGDLRNRMNTAGFTTDLLEMKNELDNYLGLKLKDILLIGKKGNG